MEDRIQAQHDWLGWGFGCLLWLQEHSNNRGLKGRAGSAPCTSWHGQGELNSLILSKMGKRRKPHKPQIRAGLDPTRKALRKGSVTPPWAHWCHCSVWIWNRNTTELLPLYPRDNWRYKLRYPGVKEQQKTSWAHSSSSGNLLSVCTRAGTDNDHHQTPEQELFWQEATAKIFYNLGFSSVETPLVWMSTSVIMSLCENLTFFFWLSKAVRTSPVCKLQLCPDYRNNCHQPFTAARALCQYLLFHLKHLPDSSWPDHATFRYQNLSWERKGWETGKEFPKESHKDDP